MRRVPRGVWWALAAAALAAAAGLAALPWHENESDAEGIGRWTGSALAAVLLALLVRWTALRWFAAGGGAGRRVWSPWVLAIAAAIALVVNVARAGDEAREDREACSSPARSALELVDDARLPAGLRGAEAERGVTERFRRNIPEELRLERLTARAVLRGGTQVALVVVFEASERLDDEEDFFAGVEEGAGAESTPAPLGSGEGRLVRTRDGGGVVAGRSDTCAVVFVFAEDPERAQAVAAALRV